MLLFGVFGFSKGLSKSKQPVPTLEISIPDTAEAKEIMRTVERAHYIEAEAAHTLDTKKFSTVFINDPRFNVDWSVLNMIKEMTNNPSLESAGYLDYKIAYRTWANDGILRQDALLKKAKAENRELTTEEKKSLQDPNGRMIPARLYGQIKVNPIKFYSVTINDDIAKVVLDDGPLTYEMNLVLVDGKWYIAGVGKTLSIHP